MSSLKDRLIELMIEKSLSHRDLSAAMGVSLSTVYRWTRAQSDINLNHLAALANYFDVSIDYLAGRSSDPSPQYRGCSIDFPKSLRILMREQNISTYTLMKNTVFDCSYFTKWERGYVPSSSTLIIFADYLNCSLDDIVYKTER